MLLRAALAGPGPWPEARLPLPSGPVVWLPLPSGPVVWPQAGANLGEARLVKNIRKWKNSWVSNGPIRATDHLDGAKSLSKRAPRHSFDVIEAPATVLGTREAQAGGREAASPCPNLEGPRACPACL